MEKTKLNEFIADKIAREQSFIAMTNEGFSFRNTRPVIDLLVEDRGEGTILIHVTEDNNILTVIELGIKHDIKINHYQK
jgi:hypothetical protein